jgi:predicted DNA-binding protein with PD1-like motif
LKIVPVEQTQHFLLRFHAGDTLPESLLTQLRERQITGGSLRLTGVLADVELQAFSSEIEGPGGTKRIAGPIQAVVLDGSLGVADGGASADLRVVLARETDRGLETIAGHLLRARVLGLDGSMIAYVDTVVPRALDRTAGVSLLRDDAIVSAAPRLRAEVTAPAPTAPAASSATPAPSPRSAVPIAAPSSPAPPVASAAPPAAPSSWSDAIAASASQPPPPRQNPGPLTRAVRPSDESEDGPYPQAGDHVEHFAFGSCEVLKSDGDRLHVRMKDGRIREIALEMLKVTPLPPDGEKSRFKLSRKV